MHEIMLPSGLVGFHNTETTVEVAKTDREIYLLHGELEGSENDTICPDCGGRMHIHGSYRVALRHLPFGARLSAISFEKKRYRCSCCGHTQMQEIPFKADGHNITCELYQYTRDLLAYGLLDTSD